MKIFKNDDELPEDVKQEGDERLDEELIDKEEDKDDGVA
jgi:hypothetical protein